MECPECGNLLRIGKTYITVENDQTPDAPTEVFTNLPMICINAVCPHYGGADLNNPIRIVETVKNKIYDEVGE